VSWNFLLQLSCDSSIVVLVTLAIFKPFGLLHWYRCLNHLSPPVKKLCYNLRTPFITPVHCLLVKTNSLYILISCVIRQYSPIGRYIIVLNFAVVFIVFLSLTAVLSVIMCVCHVESNKLTYLLTFISHFIYVVLLHFIYLLHKGKGRHRFV